jgi:hypothetical protein
MRTPLTVMAVLAALLIALALLTGSDDDEQATESANRQPEPVRVIAARVEDLRDLTFERVPRPVPVTREQARREGLQDLDREYPEARRRADEDVLKLLGLIEPGADLRALTASLFGEGVAGYYDPRNGRLRVVTGVGTGSPVLAETVLAHELTHALEDQRFGLEPDELSGSDDAALARLALVEGSATAVMTDYLGRYFTAEEALGGLVGSAFADTGDLPPFMEAQVLFPYLGGVEFVEDLRRRANGGWGLVDTAYRFHVPASSEQVLHPRAYFRADDPAPVRLGLGRLLGDGWERATAGTWGELQTRELLVRAGGGGSSEAAAGWGGDRYELWRARAAAGSDCPAPCHDGNVLVMRWRWDTRRDEAEFAAKLRAFARAELDAPAAVVRRGGAVTLAIGPSASLAARLAREA